MVQSIVVDAPFTVTSYLLLLHTLSRKVVIGTKGWHVVKIPLLHNSQALTLKSGMAWHNRLVYKQGTCKQNGCQLGSPMFLNNCGKLQQSEQN